MGELRDEHAVLCLRPAGVAPHERGRGTLFVADLLEACVVTESAAGGDFSASNLHGQRLHQRFRARYRPLDALRVADRLLKVDVGNAAFPMGEGGSLLQRGFYDIAFGLSATVGNVRFGSRRSAGSDRLSPMSDSRLAL